jgi:hypothetical protein
MTPSTTSRMSDARWARVGDLAPEALTDARLQLHHAVQIAVSAGISYLGARPDDSHTALAWSPTQRALLSENITAVRPFRIGLRVEDLFLLALDADGRVGSSFELAGRTLADGHAWLSAIATEAGLDGRRLTSKKHYEIPDHAVAHGAPFSLGGSLPFHELSRYWGNAASLLDGFVRKTDGASEVLTWPHHFDIATLITLPGARARTIGVGQSPGDESYAEPYWYVGPRPYPPAADLPALAGGGRWHTAGWFGAALPASAFVGSADQRGQISAFIDSAVAACRRLMGD